MSSATGNLIGSPSLGYPSIIESNISLESLGKIVYASLDFEQKWIITSMCYGLILKI